MVEKIAPASHHPPKVVMPMDVGNPTTDNKGGAAVANQNNDGIPQPHRTMRASQIVRGVGYCRVAVTWGTTRLRKIWNLRIFGISRRQQQHSRLTSSAAVTRHQLSMISDSLQEHHLVYRLMCVHWARAATGNEKESSVEASYFIIIVIKNSLKNWCAQLRRLWLSILGEWAVNDLIDMRQRQRGVGNGLGCG